MREAKYKHLSDSSDRKDKLLFQLTFSLNIGSLPMLRWSLLFLIVAMIAGFLGFGLVYDVSIMAFKVLFFVFLILFVVSLIAGSRAPSDVV